MRQSITLNVPINLDAEEWKKIEAIYKTMDGWIGDSNSACWYGREDDVRHIWASAEPSGLLFEGVMEHGLWTGWISVLCSRLTLALGREIHDAEM